MEYTPMVEARIKALKAELKELEGMKREKFSPINTDEVKELNRLTGGDAESFRNHIAWISRMAVCGAVIKDKEVSRYRDPSGKVTVAVLKLATMMSYDEIQATSQCATEVMEVLLKYARQIKWEGENDNTAT